MDTLFKQKRNVKKGGKMMKRAFGILIGLVVCSMVVAVGAMAQTPSTSQSGTTVIHTVYNAYGVAISGTQHSETVTTTTSVVDGATQTSTTTSIVDSILQWLGGSLKVVSTTGSNTTTDAAGRVTSTENYTDTYEYNSTGDLVHVSGSGTSTTTTYDADGVKTGSTSGSLTRTFEVRNGQALLIGQSVTGQSFDKDGVLVGEFTSNTTNTYADYRGGQWVLTQSVTESYQGQYNGLDNAAAGHNDVGSWTRTTRTTTYTRNAGGTVTGMSTTMTGTKFDVTGISGGVVSGIHSTLTSYVANYQFDATLGWFLADDTQTWTQDPDSTPYDPWTQGTLAWVNGHLALIVDPAALEGGFYSFDPTQVTGETQRDADGNYIFMLSIDNDQQYQDLASMIGHKVNFGWQGFTSAGAKNSQGYAWLSIKADGAQAYHLKNDDMGSVTKYGGTWDRTKSYVIID